MHFPIKRLERPQPIYNVDGTRNKNRDIEHYTDLEMQTGTQKTWLRFFLTDLGEQKVILGYPWFTATQPKIDWARGWLESDQLPLILCTKIASQTRIGKCTFTPAGRRRHIKRPPKITEPLYMAQIFFPEAMGKKQTLASKLAEKAGSQKGDGKIPAKYQCHSHVFSEEAAQRFPEPRIWDHAIELKKEAPSSIPGKVYHLTQDEQKALLEFVKEQQAKGYIRPSKSPYAAPFFFIKKKRWKTLPSTRLLMPK